MRLNSTLSGLTDEDWALIQELLRPSYEIEARAVRVCLTVVHGAEERHVEIPLGTFTEVMVALTLTRNMRNALRAEAALTPDALPDEPRCRCGFRAPELGPHPACPVHSLKCTHGKPVTKEEPSMFEGADPVRTFADGCQSYGPYA
ncbi:MAG TPA: hypothetical protein VFU47_02600, partial [Armatimonadota bacterium]|nr:hypothetical protein [Armatimonadota bacterium]